MVSSAELFAQQTPQTQEKAIELFERQASGGGILPGVESPDVQLALKQYISISPANRRAFSRGATARLVEQIGEQSIQEQTGVQVKRELQKDVPIKTQLVIQKELETRFGEQGIAGVQEEIQRERIGKMLETTPVSDIDLPQQQEAQIQQGQQNAQDFLLGGGTPTGATLGTAFGERAGQPIIIPNVFDILPENLQPRRGEAFESRVGEKITFGEAGVGIVTSPFRVIREASEAVGFGVIGGTFEAGVRKLPEQLQPVRGTAFETGVGEKITGEEVGRVAAPVIEFAVYGNIIRGAIGLTRQKVIPETLIKGQTKRLSFVETQVPIISDKGVKTFGKFKILTVRTPTIAETQSTIGRLLRRENQLVVLQRGQTYVTKPFAPLTKGFVQQGKRFTVVTGRVGKGGELVNLRFSTIEGLTKPLEVGGIKGLSSTEQFIFKSLRGQDGVLPFKESEKLSRGIIYRFDLSKQIGRGTTLEQTGTIFRPLKEFESGAEISKVITGFKDVTKPFARAAGKVDVLEGTIFRRQPFIIDTGTGVQSFLGGTGKKSSAQFLKQLYKFDKPKPLPKLVPKTTKATSTAKLVSDFNKPIASDLTKIFAGAGTAVETRQDIQPVIQPAISRDVFTIQPQQEDIFSIAKLKLPQVELLKTQQKEILKQQPKQIPKTITKQIPKVITKSMTKQILKTQPKLLQKQIFKQVPKTLLTIPTITPPPTTPGKGGFFFPKLKPKKLPFRKLKGFEVFGRRFGKFNLLGIGRTKGEAVGIGKSFARKTLGATFKIPKAGILKIPGFRTKKEKGDFVFIQPRRKRLSSRTELEEIFRFKREKSGKKKRKKKKLKGGKKK